MNIFRRVVGSVLPARRSLARIRAPHYTPTSAFRGTGPPPLTDLPPEDVERINAKSDEYFDNPALQAFWLDKPMSDPQHGPENLWRFGLLLSALQIGPQDRVLDFGCGTGWTSAMLARTGADVTGMDISARALRVAEMAAASSAGAERPPRLRFQRFDGSRIDAPDGHFDFVIVFDAMHHLPNPVTVLRECCRVLGPHGYLGFAEPGFGHSGTHTSKHEVELGVLENEIDPEQLWTTARAVGFRELEIILPPVPPGNLTLPMRRARWYLRGLPWIVPHDYIRAAILSYPMGFLRKGPYTSTSLHPHALLASIQPSARVLRVRAGDTFTVTAVVRNLSGTVWLRDGTRGRGAVRLGARLLRREDHAILEEWGRASLPADTLESTEHVLQLECRAPAVAGDYVIRLDMIDEGIAWFAERGSTPADITFTVG